jgi:hypothetical protein
VKTLRRVLTPPIFSTGSVADMLVLDMVGLCNESEVDHWSEAEQPDLSLTAMVEKDVQ